MWGVTLIVAAGLGAALYYTTRAPSASPWAVAVDTTHWRLRLSPGSVASFGPAVESDRAVVFVHIDRAAPTTDGSWTIDLDGTGLPSLDGLSTLSIELSGTLPAARVVLSSARERWRSARIAVHEPWTTHRLALADLEHQVMVGDQWKPAATSPPASVQTLSLELGYQVNDLNAAGLLRIGDVRAE